MKRLSVLLSLCLLSGFLFAQTIFLKKEIIQFDPNSSASINYSYDDNMHLQSIHTINYSGDTVVTKLYEDERLTWDIQPNLTMQFIYSGDSIYEYREQMNGNFALSFVHVTNSNHQVTESILVDINTGNFLGSSTYEWAGGNCISGLLGNGVQQSYSYHMDIKNPYFNQNKYFRREHTGSMKLLEFGDFGDHQYTFTVISSESGYPTEVLFNPSNNEERTIFYEYINPSSIPDFHGSEHVKVIDVKYFNLMGQEISKPNQGFYIEQTFTTNGIQCTKKYVQPN